MLRGRSPRNINCSNSFLNSGELGVGKMMACIRKSRQDAAIQSADGNETHDNNAV
jgi:hypothetical protein